MLLHLHLFLLLLNFIPIHALPNGLGRTPPLGWNTWKTCGEPTCEHDNCNEAEIKSVALAMQSNGMQKLGYNYINLDDCWASTRNATTQKLTWDTERFPSGLPNLIEFLHAKGFKFGLYTSAGNQTCSSGGRPYPIPGSEGHYALDASTFATWKVDYVKFDWCGDIKKDLAKGKQAHIDFSNAMNATGHPMFLEVVAGYFFLWDEIATVANSWRFCTDHHDSWSSTNVEMTCRLDQKSKTEGTSGGWPFMDMLITGGQGCVPFEKGPHCPLQTDDEYRTAFAIWSLTQSPLIISTDVRNMTSVMVQTLLNKELITLHQSTVTKPGKHLGYWHCSELLMCEIYGRQITTDGSSWMVVLLNRGKKQHNITVDWKVLGFQDNEMASVVNVWGAEKEVDGTAEKGAINKTISFTSSVPSHGTTVIKITKMN